jgi:uncharacterized protein (TIGR02231 family)
LDEDSLKVKSSSSHIKILGIRTKIIQHKKSLSKEYIKLEEEMISITDKVSKLTIKVQNLLKEHEDLNKISKYYQDSFSINLQEKNWSSSNLVGFIKFVESRNKKMKGSWKKAFKKYLTLSDRKIFVRQKMNELSSGNQKQQLKVWVDVEVAKSGKASLSLQYMVSNAGWEPIYDIRINSKNKTARIFQNAFVWQSTSEDWNNVNLVLSNQRSELKPTIPYISSYTLSFKEVKEVKTVVTSTQNSDQDLAQASTSSASEEDLAKRFKVKISQTIKTNRPKIKVPLSSKKTEYKEWNELVASQFPKVYKKGEIKNPFNHALAPGYVNIFYDNNYISKFFKKFTQKGEFFHINAGLDYSITVYRTQQNKSEIKGILNNKKVYQRKFSTTLKNHSNKKKKVRVYEQIPQSELDDVEVSFETKNKNYKKDLSRPSWIYWAMNLSSNKQEYINHTLKIETPKDFQFSWD